MTTEMKRQYITDKYGRFIKGKAVVNMDDNQVTAIYLRIVNPNAYKKGGVKYGNESKGTRS